MQIMRYLPGLMVCLGVRLLKDYKPTQSLHDKTTNECTAYIREALSPVT